MNAYAFVSLICCLILQAGHFVLATEEAVESSTKSFGGYDYPNLYDESIPMLWTSKLVYSFAKLLEAGRAGKIDLGDTFPPRVLELYEEDDKELDVSSLEGGKGLSFNRVVQIVKANADNLKQIEPHWEYVLRIIEKIQAIKDGREGSGLNVFLETFSSINAATECVYGVLKDINRKRVIVVFRGSTDLSTRDWQTNVSAQLEAMDTPNLLTDRLEGRLKQRVLVHRGFYNYIFNNKRAKYDQAYDRILEDIRPFVEEGYKIYVTGHSLGAALSTLLAFKLAGSDKSWIPKPVTCISYASPFVGTDGFRTAFTLLEKMGLIRYLRVTNNRDFVPTIPPFALGMRKRLMKHVGVNLRLDDVSHILSHPNTNGFGFTNALRNSIVKPVWSVLFYHSLDTHENRMDGQKEKLQSMYLNDLYADQNLFGGEFTRDDEL